MQAVLRQFESEYQKYHGLSDKRIGEQQRELALFAEFAEKDSPKDCDASDLRAYLAHLNEEGSHPNGVRKRQFMIRPFYTWGFEAGVIPAETLMAVQLVKPPKGSSAQGEPKPYSSKDLARFWAELEATYPIDPKFHHWLSRYERGLSRFKRIAITATRYQAEAIFALALEGGLRRIEIFTAEIDHIHPDNEMIVVPQRGKKRTGKDHFREVPYTSPARDAVYRWLELRSKIEGVKHDRPWVHTDLSLPRQWTGEPMSLKSFEKLPTRIGSWNYHRFRHTCATLWLRAGMELEIVQRLLGHSSMQQTQAYTEIVGDDIAKAASINEAKFRQLTRRER